MGVDVDGMEGFVEANREVMGAVIQAYEEERERMIGLRRERMSEFIANARTEIESLWEELMVGDEQRDDFVAFVDGRKSEIWPPWGYSIIDFWGKVWVKSGAWQGRAGGFQRSCNYAEVWGKSGAKGREFPADSSHSF